MLCPITSRAQASLAAHVFSLCGACVQLGFFGILLVEALAGKGIFEMVGISVGNGLGFEF